MYDIIRLYILKRENMNVRFKNKRNITKLWKDRLAEFSCHVRFFNSNRVGESFDDDRDLALWTSDQRVLFKTGQLTRKEYLKLEDKGFLFNVEEPTDSEYLYEMESIIRKSNIKKESKNIEFENFYTWYQNKEKSMINDLEMYNDEKENNQFLKLMVANKKITKADIKKRKTLFSWNEKYESIYSLMFNKKERIVSSKYPLEYRWISYNTKNKEKLNGFQKKKFKIIEEKFKTIIEQEKQETEEKKLAKEKQLKKDPSSTTYEYKACAVCQNTIYSLKGECVKCIYNRDKISKQARKKNDLEGFNAKVAAHTAKRKANRINATPNWLTDEDNAKIEKFYLEAQGKSKKYNEEYHVDHVIPLVGKDYFKMEDGTVKYIQVVCGLHTPENMQVLRGLDNKSKQARFNRETHDENEYIFNRLKKQAKKQSLT